MYPYFHALQSRQDVEVQMEGKRRIMLGSNNYLGLTIAPDVVEAGIHALERYGTGCSGPGSSTALWRCTWSWRRSWGKFLRKPGIVTFGTGYQSNVGIISALVDRHDYVICDRENHASIYAGCQMSYGKMLRYRHSDMEELEKCLQRVPEKNGALIVTDGVFSMGGDIAKLPEICALAKKVRGTGHGGRRPRPGRSGPGRPGHGQLLRPGGPGGHLYGHVFQVPGVPGRIHGGLGGGGGLCAPRVPALHLLGVHSPGQLRHGLAALRHLEQHPELPERLRELSLYARKGMTDRD